ncbi:DUF3606 domain-containing protein [Sediminibacterium soli]|uniref:DUF3606 domain-containing protein n=1 Tax=Sediminibacterium soli TaxID=2698829 RepID=UPI001379EC2A|nr:DUF3606 domain-containing protein [Sediminibacterium soli]NCI47973.1 DUF3606 domain-containing protein [Sediminibacterium soli]
MTKRPEKINQNSTQVNFNASKEIIYWSRKYNVSQAEIQELFAQTGYSIAKTIQALQQRKIAA